MTIEKPLPKIDVWTDGSCKGNPGPGGWCAILKYKSQEKILTGGDKDSTNNQMELTAVIKAVQKCIVPTEITIHCDSTYVMMTKEKWVKWREKSDLPNKKLWLELIESAKTGGHVLHYVHVEAHSGDETNERCDKLAKEQSELFARAVGWKPKNVHTEVQRITSESIVDEMQTMIRRKLPYGAVPPIEI